MSNHKYDMFGIAALVNIVLTGLCMYFWIACESRVKGLFLVLAAAFGILYSVTTAVCISKRQFGNQKNREKKKNIYFIRGM